jgi:hypothetical protein
MKKDAKIISIFELDADKKDHITRNILEKLLREIKLELPKNIKLKIVVERY